MSKLFRRRFFWLVSFIAAVLAFLYLAMHLVGVLTDRKWHELTDELYARADALAWSIEGAARLTQHGARHGNFSQLLTEMAKQPGIAWLALVNTDGRIIFDSNPLLDGHELYTSSEIKFLAPGNQLQGRYSPDDPDIFEAWKFFNPGRLHKMGARRPDWTGAILFIAMEAHGARIQLSDYAGQLWLIIWLVLGAGIVSIALVFFMRKYWISRRALNASMRLTKQIIGNYPDPLLIIAQTGKIILYNEAAAHLFGISKTRQLSVYDIGGFDWDYILRTIEKEKQISEVDIEMRKNGKTPLPMRISGAFAAGMGKGINGFLLIFRDLDKIENLKKQLAEARRLSAMGDLAAGLAHEIRNPLSSIRGYATYLAKKLNQDPMAGASADLLVEETVRLNTVLDDLLNLARPKPLVPANVDLTKLAHKVVNILKPDILAKNIQVRTNLPDSADAWLDANSILQVLLNILLNAIQTLPKNGEIAIDLFHMKNDISLLPPELRGEYIWRMDISDNGPGIPGDMLDKIFTPYFTTRAKGTGLGLSLARQMVMAHGGFISVSSAPGAGAVFSIFLPKRAHGKTIENPDH